MQDFISHLYILILFIIFGFAAESVGKNLKKCKTIFKTGMPLFFIVISANILALIFWIISETINLQTINFIFIQIIQIFFFVFCFCSGFFESTKINLPTFQFLHYGRKMNDYLSRHNFPKFTISKLFGALFLMLGGTFLILLIFKPEITEQAKKSLLKSGAGKVSIIFLVISAAFIEEIIFRFFLQTKLTRFLKSSYLAIIITSLIWAFGHSGMMTPIGVKELQIFYLGIILGIARNRWGIEVPILLHTIMNMLFSIALIF